MCQQQEGCIMQHSLVTAHSSVSTYAVAIELKKFWVMGFVNVYTGL
jgi:hypothetical protein